jgi:hypothetical protein
MFEKVSRNVRPIHGQIYMENGQILVDNLYGLYALKDELLFLNFFAYILAGKSVLATFLHMSSILYF